MLKVMIVDDTAIFRKIIKDLLLEIEGIEVTNTAMNGEMALKKISMDPPDLVLLDIEMPVLDGLSTLVEIKKHYPEISVIMISSVSRNQSGVTMEALRKGAFDFISKPVSRDLDKSIQELREVLHPVITHFIRKKFGFKPHLHETTHTPKDQPIEKPAEPLKRAYFTCERESIGPIPSKKPKKIDVVVIGISTGGPVALHKMIPMIPVDLGVPILIVQHMPVIFTKSLAEHLDMKSPLKIVEATDNELVMPNIVYIAPGGRHMTVKKCGIDIRIALIDSPPINSCRPAVDMLFESVSDVYKGNVLALIMTGMGSDGLHGIIKLKTVTCYVITQSEDSCVVYGMPKIIDEVGLSDEHVHLDEIADRITHIVKHGLV
jgi:two-component system chemotaxis response regulator CheB